MADPLTKNQIATFVSTDLSPIPTGLAMDGFCWVRGNKTRIIAGS